MFHDLYADVQETKLANGLSIYIKEWPGVSWFYTGVVVHTGAREDPPGREGLAHLVEHLVGENVAGLTFSQLKKRFAELGGQGWFGTTSYLASTYKFHLPAHQTHIQEALSLFGNMLLSARITHKIEEEKMVIVREYQRRYEHKLAREWALQGRPYLFEHHPRLGSFACVYGRPDEFRQSTPAGIQAFYDTHYAPPNVSLVCIGSISRNCILHMLQDTPFSIVKPGARTSIPAAYIPGTLNMQERRIHLADFGTLTQEKATCTVEWVVPPHFARWSLEIFGDLLEQILFEELRYKRSLTYDVQIDHEYYQDCRTFSIQFETASDVIEMAKDLVWQGLRSIRQSKKQFSEAKSERLSCIYRMDYSGHDLLQAMMGDLEKYHCLLPFSEELRQVESIQFSDMLALADYLTPERAFSFIMLP